MSDKMIPLSFDSLLTWIFEEYSKHKSIFGIDEFKFYYPGNGENKSFRIFNEFIETPVGPAAGPHTQLTQNIISAYLTGGRFFELKTVQQLDELVLDKPCIDAEDEAYNVEWSQELKIDQSYDEYLKAWIILHLLKKILPVSSSPDRGFIFNMSIGYNLEGIKTDRMDRFIEDLKDSSNNELFGKYISKTTAFIKNNGSRYGIADIETLMDYIRNISPSISNSVTLSTMHGCPPHEIEAIAGYLLNEKKLNTYVKLNPTLLGFDTVSSILQKLGYDYIELDPASFHHDLKYGDAVPMLKRLMETAAKNGLQFGIKLSNTLGINNTKGKLAGAQMYMSGRSLYPLTMNLASKIAGEFNGEINISFSGGVSLDNINEILSTGIYPVTLATGLLKPGGYTRLKQMAEKTSAIHNSITPGKLSVMKLKQLAEESLQNHNYYKEKRESDTLKTNTPLPLFDCFEAPCMEVCPIHQDIPEYIDLVEREKYNEAFNLITSKNPLPNITGYICDHQCQFKCTRWDYDESVMIREIKKEAAEKGYNNYVSNIKRIALDESNKTAVIGAGPAGLSAAYFLAKEGISVTVFDKAENAGGTVRNVIPEFRLPQSAIEKDIEFIKLHGVKFELGCKNNLSVEELQKRGYKYIFIAIGAGKSTPYYILGAEGKLMNAVEFLWNYRSNKDLSLSKNVAVIGGGNSAMDSARAALRCKGVENVYILYRRTKKYMPADKEELNAAISDGVIFKELLLPSEYKDGKLYCSKMQFGETDSSGRKSVMPIPGEYEILEIGTIISAIGESVDTHFLQMNKISFEKGAVNTSLENVFIGGDALRGPSTVIESVADGKKAAEFIINKIGNNLPSLPQAFSTVNDSGKEERLEQIKRRKGVLVNTSSADIHQESSRCLGCDLLCSKCVEVCPNRANIQIKSPGSEFKNPYQILHVNAFCNECGNCETFCPHSGLPYKDKFTIFESESEFLNSSNNGFYIYGDSNKVFLRLNDFQEIISYNEISQEFIIDKEINVQGFNESLKLINYINRDYNYLINSKPGV